MKYLIPFLLTLSLSVFLSLFFIWLAKKTKWKSPIRRARDIHKAEVFKLGGVIMTVAFNIGVIFNKDLVMTPELWGFLSGSLAFLVVGFWDDLKELFWKIQLFVQISVAVLVYIMGVKIYFITNPFTGGVLNLDSEVGVILSALLVIIWIVLIVNSLNWIDGIDGLSGGIAFITAAAIFILSFRPEVNQPPTAIISASFMGAVLGFLLFNFYPSKILAGTSGAMFMGFSLAVLAIFSGAKIATALLVMIIPIIDSIWVIGERIKNKKSIFLPDKKHLHYKLLDLGWSQKKIVLTYWLVTLITAILALHTREIGKIIVFLIISVLMIIFLFWINKKIKRVNLSK